MGWMIYSRDLKLSAILIPICSLTDIAISTTSVFLISNSSLWKYLFCKICKRENQNAVI
jgi:hypothetical protein